MRETTTSATMPWPDSGSTDNPPGLRSQVRRFEFFRGHFSEARVWV
jgi:hypothetical protein